MYGQAMQLQQKLLINFVVFWSMVGKQKDKVSCMLGLDLPYSQKHSSKHSKLRNTMILGIVDVICLQQVSMHRPITVTILPFRRFQVLLWQ